MARGSPSGSRETRPKSTTPSRPSGVIRKLPGCGSACSSPTRLGPANRKRTYSSPTRLRSASSRPAATESGSPSTHSLTITFDVARQHLRDDELVAAGEALGRLLLGGGLDGVVELLAGPLDELVDQRGDVHAAGERGEQLGQPADLPQVRAQGLVGPGVLDLHRDRAAVGPGRPVHLADGGRRGGLGLEVEEQVAPVHAELAAQHGVHPRRRHRRGVLLQLGQLLAVGPGDVVGQHRLEQAHRLAELHRAALEVARAPGTAARPPPAGGGRSPGRRTAPPSRRPRPTVARPATPSGSEASRAPRRRDDRTSGSRSSLLMGAILSCRTKRSRSRRAGATPASASGGRRRRGRGWRRPTRGRLRRGARARARPPPRRPRRRARGRAGRCSRTSWSSSRGQPGSTSRRARSVQRRQAVRPGSTSGPTVTPVPLLRSSRCGWSVRSRCAVSDPVDLDGVHGDDGQRQPHAVRLRPVVDRCGAGPARAGAGERAAGRRRPRRPPASARCEVDARPPAAARPAAGPAGRCPPAGPPARPERPAGSSRSAAASRLQHRGDLPRPSRPAVRAPLDEPGPRGRGRRGGGAAAAPRPCSTTARPGCRPTWTLPSAPRCSTRRAGAQPGRLGDRVGRRGHRSSVRGPPARRDRLVHRAIPEPETCDRGGPRTAPAGFTGCRRGARRTGRAGAQALPRMRFRFVPQTGHLAFAIRVPFSLTCTSPEASRFSLHFTQ